jgi:hypothetical protein
VSFEALAEADSDGLSASFVVASPRCPFAAKATLVLEDVMADFMCEDMTKHEPLKRVIGPCHDAALDRGARRQQTRALPHRKGRAKPPR